MEKVVEGARKNKTEIKQVLNYIKQKDVTLQNNPMSELAKLLRQGSHPLTNELHSQREMH